MIATSKIKQTESIVKEGALEGEILRRLAYFDIFKHVLRLDEIIRFSKAEAGIPAWELALQNLVADGRVYAASGYYSIAPNVSENVRFREENEQNAQQFFKKLPFFVHLIKQFPFVRSVAISGSLSKGVIHGEGDVDYFIITQPGGLWISRMTLILFKKIFLLNNKKYFCINYLIDTDNLEIPDKNLFTATEIAFLLPVYNAEVFDRFKKANEWVRAYYPDFEPTCNTEINNTKSGFQQVAEKIIFPKQRLNSWFMDITIRHWKKKFGHVRPETFELTLRSNEGVSKHHPRNFQEKVLQAYRKRLLILGIA